MRLTRRTGSVAAFSVLLAALAIAPSAGAATFSVNTTADSDDATCSTAADGCTLRDAFSAANAAPGSDDIQLPAGRYVFGDEPGTAISVDDADGVTRLIGAGARTTIVDANGESIAFHVSDNVSFEASGVTITGGLNLPCQCKSADGGGLRVGAGASLALTDVSVTRNQVRGGSGGGIANDGGDVTLTRVEVDHNSAALAGGGISNRNGSMRVVDSWLHANTAVLEGGAIDNSIVPPDGCPSSALLSCELNILPGESAAGANAKAGTLTIEGSTLSDNVAVGFGGGVASVTGAQESSPQTLSADGAGPTVVVLNSTVSGNSAGLLFGGAGGGVAARGGTVELTNATIAGNNVAGATFDDSAPGGAGIFPVGAAVVVKNTLLSENLSHGKIGNCSAGEGDIVSEGNNLDSGDSCGFAGSGDLINTDPKLGPLRDNGGKSPTHALLDGSPAIDTADNAAGPAVDQRGGHRPPESGSPGATRDIGAYEAYSLADLSVEAKLDSPDPVTTGRPLTYSTVVRNNGPDKVNGARLSDPLPGGTTLVSAASSAGTCSAGVVCDLGTLGAGELQRATVVVTPTTAGTLLTTASIGAVGITDTDATNDTRSINTVVEQPLPQQNVLPDQQAPPDKTLSLNFSAPKQVSLEEFFDGIVVAADCDGEVCLRRFREHAAINTGATHIAGFNLTVSRTSLGFSNKKKRVRLKPCLSGSSNGRRHRQCLHNLRTAAKKAAPFKVKIVVSAIDKADNRIAKKVIVKVVP